MKVSTKHLRILVVTALVLLICLSACLVASAETVSGKFNQCNWSLNLDTGALTLSGSGDMATCSTPADFPWHFYRSEIKSVTFSTSSAAVVPTHAFYGCENLKTVSLNDKVSVIEEFAFFGCKSLTSVTMSGVTKILENAFEGCTSLTSISLPSTLERIGEYAFSGSGLTSVTIPKNVRSVRASAFADCASLTSVTFNCTELQLSNYVFANCKKLTTVYVPNNVTALGYGVFDGCTSLSLTKSNNACYLGNTSNPYVILLKAASTDITSCTINNSTRIIAHGAFADCQKLASVTFGSNVTTIGSEAFANCSALTAISLPSTLSNLGDNAFSGCDKLAQISVNQNNKTFKSSGNCLIKTATKTLVLGCKASVIPTDGSVTAIGAGAFADCDELTSISIPAAVTTINGRAFEDCDGLRSVTIPSTVRMVGTRAFANCDGLLTVTIATEGSLAQEAFLNCKNLETVNFTRCPATFQERIFLGCNSLSKINVSDLGAWCEASYTTFAASPLLYGKNLYVNNELVTELVIPEGTETVSDNAFYGCESITSIKLPSTLTKVGTKAFSQCDNLFTATIPENVSVIGLWAFENCDILNSVTFLSETVQIASTAATSATTFPYSTLLFGFNGSTAETFANRYGKHTFLSLAVDRVSVFTMDVTFKADASKAGTLIPLITFTRTLWNNPIVYEPLFVDGASGELYVLNQNGVAEAAYYYNGSKIALGNETAKITIVYDNTSGCVRFYINDFVPYTKDHTPLSDFAVPVKNFITTKASKDVVDTADCVRLTDAYGIKESTTADFIGFQVNADDSSSLRVLAGIDMLYYDSVGFEISLFANGVKQGTVTKMNYRVYSGLLANGTTVSANSLGYRYVAAVSIDGIDRNDYPADQLVYFTVKPFTMVGSQKVCGSEQKIFVTYDEAAGRHKYSTNTASTHTVTSLDLKDLTFVGNVPQVVCESCGQILSSGAISRFELNFDKATFSEEVSSLANTQNGLFTFETLTSNPNKVATTDGKSVLSLPHNSSTMVVFDSSLLSDSAYYAVSFDWRATAFGGTETNQGIFALSSLDASNTERNAAFVAMVNRVSGAFSAAEGGTTHASLVATTGQWYHFNVVVNNRTGAAAVYVDGNLLASYESGFSVYSFANGSLAWRFGGQYNAHHKPEFDNFSVLKLTPDCVHASSVFVVTSEPTCSTEGTRARVCSGCGEVFESEAIPTTEHVLENTTDLGCMLRGTCTVCHTEQTVKKNFGTHTLSFGTNLDGLSVVNGTVCGTCSVCGQTDLVSLFSDRLTLAFDQASLAAEIEKIATSHNGLSTFETYSTPNETKISDGRSVLFLPHNSSSMVRFNASLLSTTDIYAVSFDWRATMLSGSSTKQGVFALSMLDASNVEVKASFVAMINRLTGEFSATDGGKAHAAITATANTWYHFTVVVDNRTGAAAVYIDDTLFATYTSGFAISASNVSNGSYAWRFGGQFNLYHQPQFDNFAVSVPTTCTHTSYKTVIVTPATCTTKGLETYVCNTCGETVGSASIPTTEHVVLSGVDFGCVIVGTCTECKTEQTMTKEKGAHTLTFGDNFSDLILKDNELYGSCSVCGSTNISLDQLLALSLDFNKSTLSAEIAEIADAYNGLSTYETMTSNPNKVKTSGDRTVLSIPHNSSTIVPFNTGLLAAKDFYAISFDWRATAITGSSSVQGIFALTVQDPENASFVASINRQTGEFLAATGGSQHSSLTATANTWYHFIVVVKNRTGAAAVYIEGNLFATYETGFAVSASAPDGTYAWRFGGQYNVYHKPEFDNFRIVKLSPGCTHVSTHIVTATAPTCYAEGVAQEVCDDCDRVLGSAPIAIIDHIIVESDLGCAVRVGCTMCTQGTLTPKENPKHTVTEFGDLSSLTLVNSKIYGTCSVCGATAACNEDVRLSLDFDRASFDAELTEKGLFALQQNSSGVQITNAFGYAMDTTNNRTVLRNKNHGRMFLNFSTADYSDAEIYVVSFDWRFTASPATGGGVSPFSICNSAGKEDGTIASNTSFGNIIRFHREKKAIMDAGESQVLMTLTENQWYTFTFVFDNATGTVYFYVNNALVHTTSHSNFKMTGEKAYSFRFGEGWSTHYPEYDNFKVYVIK